VTSRRLALGVLLGAGSLGILGDLLFADTRPGANVTLWVVAAAGVWTLLARWAPAVEAAPRWLLVPLIAAAAGFSWRDDPMLLFLDLVIIGVTLCAAAAPVIRASGQMLGAECRDLLAGTARTVVGGIVGPVPLLAALRAPDDTPGTGRAMRLAAAGARGLVVAIPLTIVFGSLLVAADARFEHLVQGIFSIPIADLVPHLFRTGFVAWVAAAVLFLALAPAPTPTAPARSWTALGAVEVSTILVTLNVLFLTFVAIQFGNLFGGREFIAATEGLTYAGYARRGFFQLVTVCALALPVLLVLAQQVEGDSASVRRYRPLARLQVALLLLILASAVHRLWLYIGEFGLSLARLHASAALLWIGATLVWFVATVLRDRSGAFLRGSLAAGAIMVGTMHLINPAAVVVRSQLARAEAGESIDADYLSTLGDDAVPTLMAALPSLSPADRTALEHGLSCYRRFAMQDLREWSLSREAADRASTGLPPRGECGPK
jgi:hypothetical protein